MIRTAIEEFSQIYEVDKLELIVLLKHCIAQELNLQNDVELIINEENRVSFYECCEQSAAEPRHFRLTHKRSNLIFKRLEQILQKKQQINRRKYIRNYARNKQFIAGKIIKQEAYGFVVDTVLGQAFLPFDKTSQSVLENELLHLYENYYFEIHQIKLLKNTIPRVTLALNETKLLRWIITDLRLEDELQNAFIHRKTGHAIFYYREEISQEIQEKICTRLPYRKIKFFEAAKEK